MTLEERITTLVDWMEAAGKTVVFTGAGISTDSGLPDFRGPDGVWTQRDKGLPAHEERDWTDSSPNVAHHATVELQVCAWSAPREHPVTGSRRPALQDAAGHSGQIDVAHLRY